MKYLPFILKHLRRNWIRTGSTVVAMALCVFLFCALRSVLAQVDRLIEGRSVRRLIVESSSRDLLPLSHAEQIRTVPGVKRVAAHFMFLGLLPARKEGSSGGGPGQWTNFFPNMAVDAEPYFAMSPELMVPPDQFRDFLGDLRGCVMGRKLAEKFGWRIGDHIFLESFVPGLRKASGPFEFVIRGLMDTDLEKYPATETSFMLFHFKYLSEGLGGLSVTLMYEVEVEDPARAVEVGSAIDALFENSSSPTSTDTERAFMSEFLSITGNLALLLNGIGLAVTFTILLVTANTMSMAVRERRTEIAVLKTLGFSSGQVMGMVMAEAVVLGALGGALGIGGALASLWALNYAPGTTGLGLTGARLTPVVALVGFGVSLALGLAAGFVPAWGAYRARVTEMLRAA